ncbi:MAG: EAL domain-containing protein, partial [Gallionella sp.]
ELKLDRSFVNKGTTDPAARAILEGSMDMARKLKLSSVAEGVETQAELELIRSLGCERVQGYLIAKPMHPDDLLAWLRSR